VTVPHATDSRTATRALRALAAEVGILDSYVDQTGRDVRETSDDTRRALLSALSIDVTTDDAALESLERLRAEARAMLIEPARVVEIGDPSRRLLAVRAPASRQRSGPWRLDVESEDGALLTSEGPWRGDTMLDISLPDLPTGYHRLRLTMSAGGHEWANEQTLIVVPPCCTSPDDLLGADDAFGVIANLYSVRSGRNWGVGDFTDLAHVGEWASSRGADFVGVNPLHALVDRDGDVSPYSPVSRLFRNPIYIDVERVPELDAALAVRERLASSELQEQLAALRASPDVRYDAVMAAKGLALDALHRVFVERVRGSGSERDRAYEAYVESNEPALSAFALWMAIAEQPGHGHDWRGWPTDLRSPGTAAAHRFAEEHAGRVDFHRWLQFETDRQLGDAADRARRAGMRIGLYQDLAIGTSPGGADTWAFPELFVHGACVGAPPDPLAMSGQNWGFPPLDPRALRRNGYRYFADLLRGAFQHAGALRVDHVLGLFRLFWIPNDSSGIPGAYVRYPTADLVGILALESQRHGALVIGEDLGTVPPEVPGTLEKWGILSSKVLGFERDWRGFKRAADYPTLSLATVNTHDMAPFAGFWSGRDVELRRELGLVRDAELPDIHATRDRERGELLALLAADGCLPSPRAEVHDRSLLAAVHNFLCRTPARLAGLSLDDLAGETDPVNVPGVTADRYPSWTRKMHCTIESIAAGDDAGMALGCASRRRSAAD
jgi:4-alpha-glucanotransferase